MRRVVQYLLKDVHLQVSGAMIEYSDTYPDSLGITSSFGKFVSANQAT